MTREGQSVILVVDDEPDNFEVIEILLFKEKYQLIYAAYGREALDYLQENRVDVILLDVMMPELDGLEVCRLIKGNPDLCHIPIIMVTSLTSKEDLARCLEIGADDFIGKPVNGVELRARVRSMLRIKHQYDALKSSLQLREDMSNMVVHDLRNPVASIIMACEVLRLYNLAEKPQQKLVQIQIAGQRLQSLIDTLLMMAKLEAGKLLLNCQEVDIYELAKKTLSDFEQVAEQRKIRLISELPEPGIKLWIDLALFRRIFDNLLSNALKFSPSQSQVTFKVFYPQQIPLSQSTDPPNQPPPKLTIEVMDEGPGVSEELQQRIFEKYETGQKIQGVNQTGLGLAFCKMAIEAHGGRIFVENRDPQGSIFTIEL